MSDPRWVSACPRSPAADRRSGAFGCGPPFPAPGRLTRLGGYAAIGQAALLGQQQRVHLALRALLPGHRGDHAHRVLSRSPSATRSLHRRHQRPDARRRRRGPRRQTTGDLAAHAAAAHAASSASGRRRTSSYVFVSSRQTAAGRSATEHGGGVGERLGQPVRRLEEHQRPRLGPRGREPTPPLPRRRGRNPSKQNRSAGSPESARAVVTADGPGQDVTGSPSTAAARGGSPGRTPSASPRRSRPAPRARAHGVEQLGQPRGLDGVEVGDDPPPTDTPSAAASVRSRRVSSAATTSAVPSAATRRETRRRDGPTGWRRAPGGQQTGRLTGRTRA